MLENSTSRLLIFHRVDMNCISVCQHQMGAPIRSVPVILDFNVCFPWNSPCNKRPSADANRLSPLTKSIYREERKYIKQKFSLKNEGSGRIASRVAESLVVMPV